jgi:hypothetical protein
LTETNPNNANFIKAIKAIIDLSITVVIKAITDFKYGLSRTDTTDNSFPTIATTIYSHSTTESLTGLTNFTNTNKAFIGDSITIVVKAITDFSTCLGWYYIT